MSTDQDQEQCPFSIFKLPFTLVGFDLSQDKDPEQPPSRSIRRSVLVALNWIFLAHELWQIDWFGGIFFVVTSITPNVLQFIIQIHIIWHLDEIREFIAKHRENSDHQSFTLVKSFSFIWFTAKFIMVTLLMALSLVSNEIISAMRELYTGLTDIFMTSMPLQCIALLLLYARRKKQLSLLYTAAREGRGDLMFDLCREMTRMFIQFERLFSVVTPTWVIYNFILTSWSLTSFGQSWAIVLSPILFFHQCLATLPTLMLVWV